MRDEHMTQDNVVPLRMNGGKDWSETDVFDLRNSLNKGSSVWLVADFLQRTEEEVRHKMTELRITELPLLERAAALCESLEKYGFECQGGPLTNNIEWQELRRLLAGAKEPSADFRDDPPPQSR